MRKEHPRPIFYRKDWLNLNGEWSCEFSKDIKGFSKSKLNKKQFSKKIIVPFCPESKLSGIGNTDFIQEMYYQKTFVIHKSWKNKKILLHFGGVDYESTIYINKKKVGLNKGGSTPFSLDITSNIIENGNNDLKLYVIDKRCAGSPEPNFDYRGRGVFRSQNDIKKWVLNKNRFQPRGKQSTFKHSYGCYYTRTTGIWQTVWLEAVNKKHIKNITIQPNVRSSSFIFLPEYSYKITGNLKVEIFFNNKKIKSSIIPTSKNKFAIKIPKPKLWSIGKPNLYNFIFTLMDKQKLDTVKSYAGMRSIDIKKNKIYLNGKPLYQRLVLDQGFYPKVFGQPHQIKI